MILDYKNKTIQMGIWWVMIIADLSEVKIYVYLTLYIRCIIMNACLSAQSLYSILSGIMNKAPAPPVCFWTIRYAVTIKSL